MDEFFVGVHQPSDANHFDATFVSFARLRKRKSDFAVKRWIMDSVGFSELAREQDLDENGEKIPNDYRISVAEYANGIVRWKRCGNLLAAVAQDYMCEAVILAKTGMTVREHQEKTVARYDELLRYETGVYIMPVLQGFAPGEYVDHLRMYGGRLAKGAWVGVGSICKRNADPLKVLRVLMAIKHHRPDLRLHGFGLKMTALACEPIRELLHTSDSMAWSYHARMHGRSGNDWREAKWMVDKVEAILTGKVPPSFSQHLENSYDLY